MILSVVFIAVLFLFSCGERWLKIAEVCKEIRFSEEKLAEVKSRETELETEYEQTKDPNYLTVKMRRLGYIYPGETVYSGVGGNID